MEMKSNCLISSVNLKVQTSSADKASSQTEQVHAGEGGRRYW